MDEHVSGRDASGEAFVWGTPPPQIRGGPSPLAGEGREGGSGKLSAGVRLGAGAALPRQDVGRRTRGAPPPYPPPQGGRVRVCGLIYRRGRFGRPLPFPVEGVARRCEVRASELGAILPVAEGELLVDPRPVDARRRAVDAGERVVRHGAAAGGERVFAIVLVAGGHRLHRRVEDRDLRREEVAEQAGDPAGDVDPRPAERRRRQHLDAGDAAARPLPLRPAPHQRQRLGDLLAAGPERRRAPEIEHHRPRPVAVLLQIEPHHLVGGAAAEFDGGRCRDRARIGGVEVAPGRQHVRAPARRRPGRAGSDAAAG